MRYLFGLLCVCALGVMPLVGCSETTGDGGTRGPSAWFWQNPLPQGNALLAVSFTDATTGTAVGVSGTIVRTTDGGTTWITQRSGTTETLVDVSFTDANNGTAVGAAGTIVRTTDGGTTWETQRGGAREWLYGVSFTDANNGTVVGGHGTILRTTDGGGG